MKKKTKKINFREYSESLAEKLQNPELVVVYLNQALADDDPRVLSLALKDVCAAQKIDIASLIKPNELKNGIRFFGLKSILTALDLDLTIQPQIRK